MTRHWTAILLAAAATALTVPAALRFGPAGFVVVTIGIGVGYGIGLAVEWATDRWPEDYP